MKKGSEGYIKIIPVENLRIIAYAIKTCNKTGFSLDSRAKSPRPGPAVFNFSGFIYPWKIIMDVI